MSFAVAIDFVLRHEGGDVNDPDDPGGHTRFGISKRAHPDEDIGALTRDRAAEIYRYSYWDACRCDELPAALALMVFDSAVNQGPRAAVETLQRAVGTVPDGILGPLTLDAAKRAAGRSAVIAMAAERGFRYGRTKNFERFGRGWMRRLIDCTVLALEA